MLSGFMHRLHEGHHFGSPTLLQQHTRAVDSLADLLEMRQPGTVGSF